MDSEEVYSMLSELIEGNKEDLSALTRILEKQFESLRDLDSALKINSINIMESKYNQLKTCFEEYLLACDEYHGKAQKEMKGSMSLLLKFFEDAQ